jgi:hypothetical protein
VQVTSVHQKVWHAVAVDDRPTEREGICQISGVVVAGVVCLGLECLREELVFQAQCIKYTDRVGGLLDTGAKASETPRLFVNVDVDPNAAQASRSGQTADAGAYDRDAGFLQCHSRPPLGANVSGFGTTGKQVATVRGGAAGVSIFIANGVATRQA